MNTKRIELAAAVGAGYLLGRTRRLKMAVRIARAGGQYPRRPQDLLAEGGEFLAATPEVTQLGDAARDELLDTTAAAEATPLAEHLESISDRLRSRGADLKTGGAHLITELTSKARRHRNPAQNTEADDEPHNS
jgi:hypothetical protein